MLREFSDDPIPIALPNGSPNPVYVHRGPCRGLTPREEAIADIAVEANNRGIENMDRGFFEEALFEFESSIAVHPTFPYSHWNRAQALLSLGRYEEGFAEFDWRFKLFGDTLWHQGIPIWNGENLAGKRLLLWHEHGYGDSILFLRYVRKLKGMGAKITLALPESLRRLAREQFSVEVLDDVPKDWDRFDYRIPIFNLPGAMKQSRERNIGGAAYFKAEGDRARIAKDWHYSEGRTIIGIAWSGNRGNKADSRRSIPIEQFLSMLETRDCALYSIQMDEVSSAPAHGVITPSYGDFAETADCLMAMDHIVTVDTAAAHLAGALGHPSLHIVVPHVAYWPWYSVKTWYPRANVYRQKRPGDWGPVFAAVNENVWRGALQ